MEDDYENVKRKTEECKEALADELDTYTFSRLSTPGHSLKTLHRKQARIIINDCFNTVTEEIDGANLQQPSLPNQTLPLTLPEYRKLLKKTDECKATLIDVLETFLQSLFRRSATGRNAQFLASLKTFHREQMLHFIEVYFNTEEVDQPIPPSNATIPSVNQLDVSSQEAASVQVVTTPSSPPISVTPVDQQQFVKIGEVQVTEEPIEEGSSTRPREDNTNTIENTGNVSSTEQHHSNTISNSEADSDCGCEDCMADKGRVQADSVMISPECGNSDAVASPPNDANVSIKSEIKSECECESDSESDLEDDKEGLSAAGHVSEMTNNQERDEAINSLLNQETHQVEESVSQMIAYAPQQASVPTVVNFNNEQVNNSVNSNFEINDSQNNNSNEAANEQESQAMITDEEDPIIIVVQYSSPLSSPSNAEQSIHSFEDGDEDLEVEESVAQMQTDTQQASVPTVVNSNNEQVNNSVNSNFENLNESQVMDFNDEDAVDEQSDAQALFDEAFVDETFPTVDFVSLPSTSTGRRSTRSKKRVIYAEPEEDLMDEDSTVNQNGKRTIPLAGKLSTSKRVTVEQVVAADEEGEDEEDEEDEVGVEAATPLTAIVHHFNCTEAECTEEFKQKAQLNGHLLSKHQIMEFRCKVKDCALSFASKSELTDHHKSVHGNLKDWPCAQCQATRKSFSELSTHFSNCHQKGRFDCSADKCDFTGKTRIQVYNHQHTHSSAKYECTFANCTASFKLKSNLTAHLRIHTQERPFACEECQKAFTTKGHLTVHERIHSGLKPYICQWPGCDYSSSQRGNVYTHVRTVHFGLPASKKKQDEQNIIDTRDAGEFIEKNLTN